MANRRKPSVVRRILQRVELPADELVVAAVDVKREREPMSPDSNHNVQCGGALSRGEVEITMKLVKSEPETSEDESSQEHDLKIREYLDRTDTAVVYPEDPAGLHDKVPLPGGGPKDHASPEDDCFIKCSFCGQGLPTFQSLKEHVDACHPGGAFPCVHCAATFPSRDQLDKHEQLHSAAQQVSCKVCNKTFANVYRLQRHMISHDESAVLRKFKCPQCEKAFKFKHHLKEHIRIHSGEKPFKCNNCGKRFSHSGSYSSHMTSKKCLVMNLKVNQRNLGRGVDLKHASPVQMSPFNHSQPPLLKQVSHNNNFSQILPKYTNEAAAAFISNFSPSNTHTGIPPFFFPPFNPSQNSPYNLQSSLSNLMERINKTPPPNQDELKLKEMERESPESEQNVEIVIKEEVKDEEKDGEDESKPIVYPERHMSGVSCNSGDLEEVKRILETVSARVTKQFLQENMQKLSPPSCSSSCPSVESGPATPPSEERSELLSCKLCKKVFTSGIELHQHERYLCIADDEKSEGLAAKLEDVATKTETNGLSCSGSEDETRGSRDIMTEDEDGDTVDQDGRKVRVRSQISEDQLIILKQNYTINPRPKREELSRIADHVSLAVRVVQVWFQNNRARDRREGRTHIPYIHQTPWLPPDSPSPASEQPLDLSTKKSQSSSPASSPPRTDSDMAVNLTQKAHPRVFVRPMYQNRSPSPLDSSRLARMLTQPGLNRFPNGSALGSSPMDTLFYASSDQSASRSPVPGIAMYNGSSSPSSGSELWWKRTLMETPEPDYADDTTKRPKMATEPDSDGQLYTCDQCEKAFSKQSSLARHRFEHSGQRPHKCDVCQKAFKHKHHLTEHKRLHSGEKPFQCSKCLKRFSHSGSYSQHMNHRFSYCKPYRE